MAKNIFATNYTLNKENGVSDGESFITARTDEDAEHYIQKSSEELLAMTKKLTRPISLLEGLVLICGIAILVIISASFGAIKNSGITIGEAFGKVPALFIAAAVLAIAGISSFVVLLKKNKSYLTSDEKLELDRKYESIKTLSLSFLGAPEKTIEFDVLSFGYEIKNGKMNVIHKKQFDYSILSTDFFVENGIISLCLFDERYDIPLSQIKALNKVRSKVKGDCWMKDDKIEKYEKGGKISEDKNGTVHFAPYYSLEIKKDGEDYELLFPFWEYETFVNMTGIKESEE